MEAKAVFLDKDGTLVEDVPYNTDPDRLQLMPGTGPALAALHRAGYQLVVVSNQSGIARGYFREEDLGPIERRLTELLAADGVPLAGFYYCPHWPGGVVLRYAIECRCRKPAPGLLLRAADELGLDCRQSWMIGDILDDVEAGVRAGCRSVLLNNGHETQWRHSPWRRPHCVGATLTEAAQAILAAGPPQPREPAVAVLSEKEICS